MTGRQTITTLVCAWCWTFAAHAQFSKPVVSAEISRLADTAHVEFKGLRNWRYEVVKDGERGVLINIPAIDEASVAKLQSFTDPLVESVKVEKQGPDGGYQLRFTLARADVESFDYLTDDPSRLIVDFYRKAPEAPKASVAVVNPAASVSPATPAKPAIKKPRTKPSPDGDKAEYKTVEAADAARRPAGDEFLANPSGEETPVKVDLRFGIFDGSDENYDRFRIKDYEIREDAVISSRQNIYLAFPMLKMKVSELSKLMEEQPEYLINPKDTKENREARLLLTLFQRKRYAVFQKTFDYFTGKYPESEYTEILKNLMAHVYLERWREENKSSDFEHARAYYSELVQKFPESPLREHNFLILGFAQMEHGDALSTLQTFEGFLKNYPKSPEVPVVRKALAESYMILRKFDEATAEYRSIMRDFPKTAHAQEARYRLGDVHFAKGDYSAAITEYEAAIKEFPAAEKVYPNADFNMAEARFWQKDFKKSLNGYVQFVNLFPTDEYGGYALTRIGELLGILGADQRRVMGAFLESYFRFPNHPGARVARVRMLSQQMRGMKPKEVKKAIEEIAETEKSLKLPGIQEFATLMVAEGLTHRGENKQALENLIAYYQKNPMSANVDIFKGRILRNISNELKDQVDGGNFMKALEFYSQYQKTWLKGADRIDVPYFVGGAYERAGAYSEARAIYQDALNQRDRIKGTPTEREKKIQEHLPSLDSLHLRLASTMAQDRDYIDAYQHLKAIGAGADLSPVETVERVQLSAMIAEQRNDHARARETLQELAKKWQGDPALVAPVHLQLAQTFMKLKDPRQAEEHADRVLASEGGDTKLEAKLLADALALKGDAQLAQKRPLAAVETYQNLLERFEDKRPLATVRYQVGQILFDRGDMKGAADVWSKLEGSPNEYLWKIGREKLQDAKWQDDYTKYTKRIPAMVSSTSKDKEKNP